MQLQEIDLQKTYDQNQDSWFKYIDTESENLKNLLFDVGIKPSLKKRVKSIQSLNIKAHHYSDKGEQVSDLLGLRIMVPFLEDIEKIIEVIEEYYTVNDIERKSDSLSFREFAYDSVHIEISLEGQDLTLPKFCKRCCEIQIRTTLQDAWAEVEHKLVYKNNSTSPEMTTIKKKLAALNANLALSDMIFQEIKDKQKELQNWGQERFKELQKQAREVSLKSLEKYTNEPNSKDPSTSTEDLDTKEKLETCIVKALKQHNNEHYPRAIELYTEALDYNPDLKIRGIIYNHRGLANFMINNERQALKDFENSYKCDQKNHRIWNNKALVLRRLGLTNEAILNFNGSLELKNNQPDVFFLRGQTYFELGEIEKAKNDFKNALAIDSNHQKTIEFIRKNNQQLEEA
jgi:putative GTP pyrophosphokinase